MSLRGKEFEEKAKNEKIMDKQMVEIDRQRAREYQDMQR